MKGEGSKMARYAKSPTGILIMMALLIAGGLATKLFAVDPRQFFELEGDIHDDPAGGPNDWENNLCPDIGGSTASVNTGVVSDPHPLSIFTQGGSKDKLDINNWMWKDGSVPDKDDIENSFAAEYDVAGTSLLYVGGTRFANDGSAFIGAWFFQNSIGTTGTGATASPFTGVHKNGDLLILAEFTQGGAVSTLKVFEWVGSAGDCPGGPCPAPTEKGDTLADVTASAASAFGFSNSIDQVISCPADWPYTPKAGTSGTIPVNSFFEVGIDLGELGLENVCFSSFLLETRSSHDVDAQLKDFVLHAFKPCNCKTDKQVAPAEVCEGGSATYTFTVSSDPGSADLDVTATDDVLGFVCMPGADGAPCTFQSTPCTISLPGGTSKSCTRTVTESAGTHTDHLTATGSPAGGTGAVTCEDSTATLIVNATPAVTINHLDCNADTATQGGSFTLTATPSGGTPPYGLLWTPGNQTSASISSTAIGTYSVAVTDAKGCTASATRKVGYCSN
jgi:hypothetical protein